MNVLTDHPLYQIIVPAGPMHNILKGLDPVQTCVQPYLLHLLICILKRQIRVYRLVVKEVFLKAYKGTALSRHFVKLL